MLISALNFCFSLSAAGDWTSSSVDFQLPRLFLFRLWIYYDDSRLRSFRLVFDADDPGYESHGLYWTYNTDYWTYVYGR